MPRVELFDKSEVMERALNLFWRKGYEATSLRDLTEELGIGKGSFYNTFGSKRELFNNCLSVYREGGYEVLGQILTDKEHPIDGIRNFLTLHTQAMLDDGHARGCLIANSSAEMAHDMEMQNFLLEHNNIMKSKLIDYLFGGSLAPKAEIIADALLIHVTGISVISKFMKDPERFKASNEQFLKSLEN